MFCTRTNVRVCGCNRIRIGLTEFRLKPYALSFGGPNECGTSYSWIGLRIDHYRKS